MKVIIFKTDSTGGFITECYAVLCWDLSGNQKCQKSKVEAQLLLKNEQKKVSAEIQVLKQKIDVPKPDLAKIP